MTHAQRIMEKFGGKQAFGKRFNFSPSWLFRMTKPEAEGGTGGKIPPKHHQRILDAAREDGIALTPADFFEDA